MFRGAFFIAVDFHIKCRKGLLGKHFLNSIFDSWFFALKKSKEAFLLSIHLNILILVLFIR